MVNFKKVGFFHIFSDFLLPEMPLPLRYGASVMDCTQKIKQNLKGTKYVNLLSSCILCYFKYLYYNHNCIIFFIMFA